MKLNKPFLLLIPFLLTSCGGITPGGSGASSNSMADDSEASSLSREGETGSKEDVSSIDDKDSSGDEVSSDESVEKDSGSQSGYGSDDTGSVDTGGIIEEAYAGDGVILTDWTAEMKAIFNKYLGIIPPFFALPSIRVTYDELGYVSVTADGSAASLEDYGATIYQAGWDGYLGYDSANRVHCYARYIATGVVYELDAMIVNGIFSVNFDFTFTRSDWPSDDLNAIFLEYGTNAVLPVLEADQYVFQVSSFYDASIFCMGEGFSNDTVEDYAALLTENRWRLESADYDGMTVYTGTSLDALANIQVYFDGTGVEILLSHGEGESYTSWAQIVPAIEDFVKNDLRLEALSLDIPSFDAGVLYEVNRAANGWLNIDIYKNGSFKRSETETVYKQALIDLGYTIDETRIDADVGLGYFALPPEKDFAIAFLLNDSANEYGDANNYFTISILDYRGYEGWYVDSVWPDAQVRSLIGSSGAVIPGLNVADAVYYFKFNTSRSALYIDIVCDDPADAFATYKSGLVDYDFTLDSESETTFKMVDPSKKFNVEAEVKNGELDIAISGYVRPVSDGTISFADESMLSDYDYKNQASYAIWGGDPFAFRVDNNTATQYVGNYGDYLANPLRIYKNQIVSVYPAEGKELVEVAFYIVDVYSKGTTIATGFSISNFVNSLMNGATLKSSNADLGKYVFTVDADAATSGISFTASGHFGISKVVATVQ